MTVETPTPLAPEESARLTEFARACKAAARAVVLYPPGHPAIAATLGRIVNVTSQASLPEPLNLTVLPDALLLDDRPLARTDPAVIELAALLHSHVIGHLVVHPGGNVEAWRSFLMLLGRAPEAVRAEGGIARVWTTMAGRHVELREIDYAQVLRDRPGGQKATWDQIVTSCLQGSAFELDDEAVRELMSAADDRDALAELLERIEQGGAAGGAGVGLKTAAIIRLIRTIIDAVATREPSRMEPVLRNMAAAVGRLTPDLLLGLLRHRREAGEGVAGGLTENADSPASQTEGATGQTSESEVGQRANDDLGQGAKGQAGQSGDDKEAQSAGTSELVTAVVSRMTDATIARFVAREVISHASPTDRLAQVFQTLVRDSEQQLRLLTMARADVAASPLGSTEGFETVWDHVAEKLLTSYSDEPFVSDDYARELSSAREQAVEVEQLGDDPPDRISAWVGSVATPELRTLDLTLVLDLLRIEGNDDRWGELMTAVGNLIEDLLLVGDFEPAAQIIAVLVAEARGGSTRARQQHAIIGIDLLIAGSMLRHIVAHLATIDDAQFERLKEMCVSLGVVLVRPLAETLAVEQRPRTRERLTSILVAFGPEARKTIERLKASQNAAVRRTAIYLMREFAGSEALPDLMELLDDNEPQVQREAVRAILNIGSDEAYKILQQALTSGTDQSRQAIMQSISSVRDDRATPLFVYILNHVDHRGRLAPVYLRAIESLGSLKDAAGVPALKQSLYKGEWWAPGRTRALRSAAAAALARIGTSDAWTVLEEAAVSRLRGVRAAARPHVMEWRRREARRGHLA